MEEEVQIPKHKFKINWLKIFQFAESVIGRWTMIAVLFGTGYGIGVFSNNFIKNAEIKRMADERSDLNTQKNIQTMKYETEINRLNIEINNLNGTINNIKDSKKDGK